MNDYAKVFLDVPFAEKDKAKEKGAKWDVEQKQWYCFEVDKKEFKKWFEKADKPEKDLRVINESAWKYSPVGNPKLYVDLIPETSWCNNLRSGLDIKDWDLIRKAVYRFGKYKCELCDGVGPKHPVEAHERWEYDDEKLVQRLVGISCLCPACHQATHYGLANIQGNTVEADNQLRTVNNWTTEEIDKHVEDSYELWKARSEKQWKLDISWLLEREIEFTELSSSNITKDGDYWTFIKHIVKNNE